jgi:hypothetical protein
MSDEPRYVLPLTGVFLLRILYNHLLYHTHDRSPDGCEEWRFYQPDTVGSDRGLRGGTATYPSEHKVLPLTHPHRSSCRPYPH